MPISHDPAAPVTPYPDPGVEILDPSFTKYRSALAGIERLATGFRWAEGPVWFGDGRFLLFSDIPNNRILKWEEETERVHVFRQPSFYANGNTRDRNGRLITCEHQTRRVTRTGYDGTITVLADSFQGKRLNSPNDVVVKSDGTVWFTDPPYGITGWYLGAEAPAELPQAVYRLDPETGELTQVIADMEGANGLAFSPDESRLYLVARPGMKNRVINVCDVSGDGATLSNQRLFFDCGEGIADGFRVDAAGNLWMGWGFGVARNGVLVLNPDGKPIGHIHTPERVANLTFGGAKRNRLFMCGSQSLYS
ncbi:MAG: SMP-30/gluconolactonase/LRE family protein, partial [Methylobacteriaceae bacterium]|nr:SMP-30/gluconolactonase/LRE family protein [Methylobacteriaceae bacterium]